MNKISISASRQRLNLSILQGVKFFGILLILIINVQLVQAQKYEVKISPFSIEGLGGLQSYSIGTHNGQWLLIGGRLDGLHRRQPFAAFDQDGRNQELIVVDPKSNMVWKASLSALPSNLKEQLSSTNMQFYQDGEKLLCTGGYGYSPSSNDHITFPFLTIIDIPKTIENVKNNNLDESTFYQIQDEMFRVTGGGLNQIDDTYYLVGGQSFMGRYNPMGPDHGPGFVQQYTNEIRKFKLENSDVPNVEILIPIHDEMHLHRRDYNLVPFLANGKRKLMVYSGVFKNTVDLPWLYPVSISSEEYNPIQNFSQYFNHYHCANLPIYNQKEEEMYTLFFGGIAQFYKADNVLVQDNDVPFVNTIAEISHNKNGEMQEVILPTALPDYLGAGSVFIPNNQVSLVDSDIIDGSKIDNEFIDVGYIYGGIKSSLPNIFWINNGEESNANETIFKVSIRNKEGLTSSSVTTIDKHLQFYPDPERRSVRMSIEMEAPADLSLQISNSMGQVVYNKNINKADIREGKNLIVLDNVNVDYGAFFYTVKLKDCILTRKVIWSE